MTEAYWETVAQSESLLRALRDHGLDIHLGADGRPKRSRHTQPDECDRFLMDEYRPCILLALKQEALDAAQ